MDNDFVNMTEENLNDDQLCCIVRKKKVPGIEAKRIWLQDRLQEGHVLRKLETNGTAFIEYAPLETAWTPITGDNYIYLYCLWVDGELKGKGYGKQLMEYCINDTKQKGKSGICMLGAKKQKAWLSDQSFAKKYGFKTVDTTDNGYELLALSFDGTTPRFSPNAKRMTIASKELTIYYDQQCPFILQEIKRIQDYGTKTKTPLSLIKVDTLQKAKALPCVFNNWAIFSKGRFQTVNLLDIGSLERMLKK